MLSTRRTVSTEVIFLLQVIQVSPNSEKLLGFGALHFHLWEHKMSVYTSSGLPPCYVTMLPCYRDATGTYLIGTARIVRVFLFRFVLFVCLSLRRGAFVAGARNFPLARHG